MTSRFRPELWPTVFLIPALALLIGAGERSAHVPEQLALDQALRDRRAVELDEGERGAIGLDKVGRAYAWLAGRDYVTPADIQAVVHDVFRHRLILSYEAHAEGTSADQVIDALVEKVAVA